MEIGNATRKLGVESWHVIHGIMVLVMEGMNLGEFWRHKDIRPSEDEGKSRFNRV